MRTLRSLLAGTVVMPALCLVTVAGLGSSPASAGTVPCSSPPAAQYFSQWGDLGYYFLAPGASFVPGTADAWTMAGGAGSVQGGDPWNVTGASPLWSADIPAGGTVTSQSICLSPQQNAVRFFYRSPGTPGSVLQVLIRTSQGSSAPAKVLLIGGTAEGWQVANLIDLPSLQDANGNQDVTIAFRAVGRTENSAPWQVDDVMVDPWASN